MAPTLLSDGRILQVGKSGTGYLLTARHLGGVAARSLKATSVPRSAAPPSPAPSSTSPASHRPDRREPRRQPHPGPVARPAAANGSPAVGGGAVWVADWASGTLYQLAPATGRVRTSIRLGSRSRISPRRRCRAA